MVDAPLVTFYAISRREGGARAHASLTPVVVELTHHSLPSTPSLDARAARARARAADVTLLTHFDAPLVIFYAIFRRESGARARAPGTPPPWLTHHS